MITIITSSRIFTKDKYWWIHLLPNIFGNFWSIAYPLFSNEETSLSVIPASQWCSLTLCTGQVFRPQWCVMGVIVIGVGVTSQGWMREIQFLHHRKMKLLLCKVCNLCNAEWTYSISNKKTGLYTCIYLQFQEEVVCSANFREWYISHLMQLQARAKHKLGIVQWLSFCFSIHTSS